MATSNEALNELNVTLEDIGQRFPRLAEDAIFTLWFLRAYLIDSEKAAAEALCGITSDKNTDAVLVEDNANTVFIVQSKYRQGVGIVPEKRNDLIGFAELAVSITDDDRSTFEELLEDLDPAVGQKLAKSRELVTTKGYKLAMVYITMGSCSETVQRDSKAVLKRVRHDARLEILDGDKLLQLHRDYLDGVAPPVPTLDLHVENSPDAKVTGNLQRYDNKTSIEAWVFSMRGDTVAELFRAAGLRLFARNIRGYLGAGRPVNRQMVATLRDDPQHFFYYNNGVTIVCDHAEKRSHQGREIVQVSNPQVINGQQTTRTLAAHIEHAAKATVLVKVIQVPRQANGGSGTAFEDLVSKIVAGTNWQNAISPSDLMSNDRAQVEIEREFRKLEYFYVRKRQTKSEIRMSTGGQYVAIIHKDELAQGIAACEIDAVTARTQKEGLFGEDMYSRVFPNSDPWYYLPRYWAMRTVKSIGRGSEIRLNSRWLVLHYVWDALRPTLRGARRTKAFVSMCRDADAAFVRPFHIAIESAFKAAAAFYKANSKPGKKRIEIPKFFKSRAASGTAFAEHLAGSASAHRDKCLRNLGQVQKAIEAFEG